ncbi:MAG: hypothetical protein Q9187_007574, partial [Circinaria calcarea]
MESLKPIMSRGGGDAVIRSIREDYGVSNDNSAKEMLPLKRTLESAVALLAEQLNSADVHFVHEMIQNADDNQYPPEVSPRLSFHLSSSKLRIDCNEAGFSEQNVRALCNVNKSTKTTTGTIGEKGVGFKSVFKIADSIAVSSGRFSFMFDRNAELGMIAPQLAEFPVRELVSGHTQFLMQIKTEDKRKLLKKELEQISPSLLMFLRRLKRLDVYLDNGFHSVLTCRSGATSGSILLETKTMVNGVHKSTFTSTYIVVRRRVESIPSSSKRLGTNTAITLAFLTMYNGYPHEATQDTYAYLPIRDFGFKFIIQADFMLSASREDILSNDWNLSLLNGVVAAFCEALEKLNKIPTLRYTWIRYLPTKLPKSFLFPLENLLIQTLRDTPSLWSWAGTLVQPGALSYVPAQFLDRHKHPLIGDALHLKSYLSPRYAWITDRSILEVLGVRELSIDACIIQLAKLIDPCSEHWAGRQEEWHEDVASVLNRLADKFWVSDIPNLKLIPLQDGNWTSYNLSRGRVLLDDESGIVVPADLGIQLVDVKACLNPARLMLFKRLGVLHSTAQEVVGRILEKHNSEVDGGRSYTPQDSLVHLVYLYKVRKSYPSSQYGRLWLLSKKNRWVRAEDLYLDISDSNSLSKLFEKDPQCLNFVHPIYVNAIIGDERTKWLDWLETSVGLSTALRLAEKERLSRAFQSITKNHDSVIWLGVLKSTLLKRSDTKLSSPKFSKVCQELSSLPVICSDGSLHTLKGTFLPSSALIEASTKLGLTALMDLPFVNTDEPNDKVWADQLNKLGVVTLAGTPFYTGVLQCIKEQASPKQEQICSMYTALSDRTDRGDIRSKFKTQSLIYLPSSQESKWVSPSVCVWQAPPGLQTKAILHQEWPQFEGLFRRTLKIDNASAKDIINEILSISERSSKSEIEHLKGFLLYLSWLNRKGLYNAEIQQLRGKKVFPVIMPGPTPQHVLKDYYTYFYIADHPHLYANFSGRVSLLDFSVDEVHKLMPVLQALGVKGKLLSANVTEVSRPDGITQLQKLLTSTYADKASALMRCADHWKPAETEKKSQEIYEQLRQLKVYSAARIVLTRTLNGGKTPVIVETDGQFVMQTADASGLRLYFPEDPLLLDYVLNGSDLSNSFAQFLAIPMQSDFIGTILRSDNKLLEKRLEHKGVPK